MSYEIIRSDKADEQLEEIVRYIAMDSGSTEIALNFLEKLERSVMRLADSPEMGVLPRYYALRRRGYRVLIVDNYMVFYKIDHDTRKVIVYAIVDSRRNYKNLIE